MLEAPSVVDSLLWSEHHAHPVVFILEWDFVRADNFSDYFLSFQNEVADIISVHLYWNFIHI